MSSAAPALSSEDPCFSRSPGTVEDVSRMGGSNDVPLHASIAGDMVKAGWSIDEAARRLAEVVGRPATDEELAELRAARERADAIAGEHGPDYHGFGNPTEELAARRAGAARRCRRELSRPSTSTVNAVGWGVKRATVADHLRA